MSDTHQALQNLLNPAGLPANAFPPTSRYHGLETASVAGPDGQPVVYVRRRFLPQPGRFATLSEHTVRDGERLDVLAARFLGDPEQFWRLCDANGVMDPAELEAPGVTVRLTLPEGIPGTSRA